MSLYEGSTRGASDEVADEKEVDDSNGGEGKSCANQSTGTRRLPQVGGAMKLPGIGVGRQRCPQDGGVGMRRANVSSRATKTKLSKVGYINIMRTNIGLNVST